MLNQLCWKWLIVASMGRFRSYLWPSFSMLHHWSLGYNGTGKTVRTILFNHCKAFNFIDHNLFINKLCKVETRYTLQHCKMGYGLLVKSFATNQISWRLLLWVRPSPIWGTTGYQTAAVVIYPSDTWSYYSLAIFMEICWWYHSLGDRS